MCEWIATVCACVLLQFQLKAQCQTIYIYLIVRPNNVYVLCMFYIEYWRSHTDSIRSVFAMNIEYVNVCVCVCSIYFHKRNKPSATFMRIEIQL